MSPPNGHGVSMGDIAFSQAQEHQRRLDQLERNLSALAGQVDKLGLVVERVLDIIDHHHPREGS